MTSCVLDTYDTTNGRFLWPYFPTQIAKICMYCMYLQIVL